MLIAYSPWLYESPVNTMAAMRMFRRVTQ